MEFVWSCAVQHRQRGRGWVRGPPDRTCLGGTAVRFIPQLRIAQKLPLALVGSALVVSAGVGIASYFIGLGTVQEQREQAMQASLNTAVTLVGDYFSSAEVDLRLFVQRSDTVTAMKNLTRALDELRMGLKERAAPQLQAAYEAVLARRDDQSNDRQGEAR